MTRGGDGEESQRGEGSEGKGEEAQEDNLTSPVEMQGVREHPECRELDRTMLAKDGFVNKIKQESSQHLPPPSLSPPHLSVLLISGNLILQAKSSVLLPEDQELVLKMNMSL